VLVVWVLLTELVTLAHNGYKIVNTALVNCVLQTEVHLRTHAPSVQRVWHLARLSSSPCLAVSAWGSFPVETGKTKMSPDASSGLAVQRKVSC
jgi:hypothetical protein